MGAPRYVYSIDEGSADMRNLLGGKGAGLAEMYRVLGPGRVPAAFTITTEACLEYLRHGEEPLGLSEQIDAALQQLEERCGRRLGDPEDPLLVSVRSGARVSMPGMMDTVLNLGLNSNSVEGLSRRTDNPRFAWDSYRRFCQMFGNVVRGVDGGAFESIIEARKRERGIELDIDLDLEDLKYLVTEFQTLIEKRTGKTIPENPRDQLREAITAVFESWQNRRAVEYRRMEGIPDNWGTAANVQQMVFGNTGSESGSGVAFSRDGVTGGKEPSGDFLFNAQGEDVVNGSRKTFDLNELGARMPEVHSQLIEVLRLLERHYKDMQDVEFTVEDGHLYLLQTRSAKRPAKAALRFAVDAVEEGLLSPAEALLTIDASRLESLFLPQFDPKAEFEVLTTGVAASPGAAKGEICLSAARAVEQAAAGKDVLLVRQFTDADDVAGFNAARGILTAEGGRASHAALVARGLGRPCVSGAAELSIDDERGIVRIGGREFAEGDLLAIDGSTGIVTADDVEFIEPTAEPALETVLKWADELRRLRVRANADTPDDARRAIDLGAEGIGLCRTEHMFFGSDRDQLVRDAFIAAERRRRSDDPALEEHFRATLDQLEALQRSDFEAILRAMGECPVNIRLLDPPLHEFLPVSIFEEAAQNAASEAERAEAEEALAIARDLAEANPMLGTRGSRLALIHPEIYEMQVRAIAEAATAVVADGIKAKIEVMLPLIAYEGELERLRGEVERIIAEVEAASGQKLDATIGTMVELPRACLIADRIAVQADFFSFGTNDLTQTTLGFSRDDVEGKILPTYSELGILDLSPFDTLDTPGVGELVRIGCERGRSVKPDLKLGICGEHGGDPKSIEFFESIGLEYVSCSANRIPVARLAAAQAAIRAAA